MGVGAHRHAERTGEAKVGEFEHTGAVDQQILRFQVAVQHAVGVAERNTGDELVQVRLSNGEREGERRAEDKTRQKRSEWMSNLIHISSKTKAKQSKKEPQASKQTNKERSLYLDQERVHFLLAHSVHILLEVLVQELEHQIQLIVLVNGVFQATTQQATVGQGRAEQSRAGVERRGDKQGAGQKRPRVSVTAKSGVKRR